MRQIADLFEDVTTPGELEIIETMMRELVQATRKRIGDPRTDNDDAMLPALLRRQAD